MKKFLTTLIYGTLACIVLIYLFSAMHWPGFENVALGVLWLHVGSYLTYSVVVPEKESRIIYPLVALSVVVLVNIFKLGADATWMGMAVYFFLSAYAAFHLLTKDFLDENDLPFLKKLNIVDISIYLIGGVMQLASLQFSSQVFIVGSGLLALMLLLTGSTKGLKRKK